MIDDGFAVIRFEPRGCGRSDKDGKYDIGTTISDMEAIRKYYKIDSWIVGGHSFGAIASLFYSINYPDKVNSLLFIAGIGVQNNREWLEEFYAKRDKYGELTPDFLYPFSDEVNKATSLSFRKYIQTPSLYKDISKLRMPALFLWAENDIRSIWPVHQIQMLIENSVLIAIPGAAHYIWLTHYDKMMLELRKYLGLFPVEKFSFRK